MSLIYAKLYWTKETKTGDLAGPGKKIEKKIPKTVIRGWYFLTKVLSQLGSSLMNKSILTRVAKVSAKFVFKMTKYSSEILKD